MYFLTFRPAKQIAQSNVERKDSFKKDKNIIQSKILVEMNLLGIVFTISDLIGNTSVNQEQLDGYLVAAQTLSYIVLVIFLDDKGLVFNQFCHLVAITDGSTIKLAFSIVAPQM